ncbi:MAG: S9 family peptidase, partial [Candidatus Neomarinimicrobiota bacterium]
LVSAGRKITPEDIVDLKYVSSPVLDPSGQYIAYTLSVPRGAEDKPGKSYSEIWVTQTDGSNNRRYTSPKVNSWAPQWSSQGTSFTFLSKRKADDKLVQIYAIPIHGGEG